MCRGDERSDDEDKSIDETVECMADRLRDLVEVPITDRKSQKWVKVIYEGEIFLGKRDV